MQSRLPILPSTSILSPVPRRKVAAFTPREHDIQSAFVAWCALAQRTMPLLALGFAVPNGGKRHIKTASSLKKEGVRAGVPDWLLPVPCGEFSGLAIEFKRPGNTTTPSQKDYINLLISVGWHVEVCDCSLKAADVTTRYLRLGLSKKHHSFAL